MLGMFVRGNVREMAFTPNAGAKIVIFSIFTHKGG